MKAVTQIGITLGDPSGIGPEIVAAALAAAPREWLERITVYGDRAPLERGARAMRVSLPDVRLVGGGDGDEATPGTPA